MNIGISIRLFTPGSGGLQYHAAALIRHLRERGHQVTLATRAVTRVPSYHDFFYFSEAGGDFEAVDSGLRVLRHSRALNPFMWLALKCVGRPRLNWLGIKLYQAVYARQLEDCFQGVDIIHHIGNGSEMIGFAAAAAARRLNVPFVVQPTIHPGQWGDSGIDFTLYQAADHLLVHTNYEQAFFRKKGQTGAISVVGNGIEDRQDGVGERFRRQHGITGRMILFVGRKESDKGYPLLLRSFAQLRQEFGDACLVCMGPGKAASQGEARIIELGFCDEAAKHDALAACDLMCVPSEAESFGLIYMEAARYRKPMVARKLPVLEELLGTGNAAILVGKGNGLDNRVAISVEELTVEIARLLSDPAEQKRMGDNAFAVSQRFLWAAITARFEQTYQATLGNE